jgi:SRSO17 transposase
MPVKRKSVEPMAAMVSPARASAAHQSLLHFVGQSAWSDEAVLGKVRDLVAPAFEAHGDVEAWIVDDMGYQKKGSHSVEVARQYCGRLSKTEIRRDDAHQPLSAKALAMCLPVRAWNRVAWREGSNQALSSRFAAVRLWPASRDHTLAAPHPLEWLVVEWPEGEAKPTKYWLFTLPQETALKDFVGLIKLRWRIERDDEELKSELGLAQFEGRGWRGFHHHASLCIAAYGFLPLERAAIPPSATWRRERPAVSGRARSSRPAAPPETARGEFHRNAAKAVVRRSRQDAVSLPMLSNHLTSPKHPSQFVTK